MEKDGEVMNCRGQFVIGGVGRELDADECVLGPKLRWVLLYV